MRFGDVQDTRKKEMNKRNARRTNRCFEKEMDRLSNMNRNGRVVMVGGVMFTI